jgi:hypothetical protein
MDYSAMVQRIADVVRPELEVAVRSRCVHLQESNPGGQHSTIKLGNCEGALALSFDQCYSAVGRHCADLADWLHPLFRAGKDLRLSCDYVVFHEKDNTLWVLLIELKSRHTDKAREQLARTRLLAEYLLSMAWHGDEVGVQANPQFRGIVFKEMPAQKLNARGGVTYIRDWAKMRDLGLVTVRREDFYKIDVFCV